MSILKIPIQNEKIKKVKKNNDEKTIKIDKIFCKDFDLIIPIFHVIIPQKILHFPIPFFNYFVSYITQNKITNQIKDVFKEFSKEKEKVSEELF